MADNETTEAPARHIFDSSPDPILFVDGSGTITFANRRVRDVFGYGPEELEGEPVDVLVPPDDREDGGLSLPVEDGSASEPTTPEGPVSVLHADGSEVPVEINVNPVDRDEGREMMAVVRDVSARVEHRTKYRMLLETAPDPVLVADAETGDLVDANDAATEMLGYSVDELEGASVTRLHPSGEEERYRELFATHVEESGDGPTTFRYLPNGGQIAVEAADGTEIPVEINARVVEVDGRHLITGIFREIGDRADATSPDRFEAIVEASDRATAVMDSEGRIEYANPAFEDLTGYAANDSATAVIGDRRDDAALENLWQTVEDGEIWQDEILARRATGETYYADQRVVTLGEEKTGSRAFAVFQRDVTERVRRRTTRDVYEAAIENAGHSIYWTDRYGTIEYVNPAFERTTGYDRETAVGRDPSILKSGEMSDAFYEELWRTILGGEVFEAEIVNENRDGERYVVDQTIAPIEDDDGSITHFVAVNADVTEKREYERQLERYETIVERTNDAIFTVDGDRTVGFANERVREIVGPDQGVTARPIAAVVDDLTPGRYDVDAFLDGLSAVLEGETDTFETELPVDRPDLDVLWVRLATLQDDGSLVGGFARDVSERSALEKRLSVANRILRHDIRSAVNIIRGNANLGAGEEAPPDQVFETIRSAADRLLDISEKAKILESGGTEGTTPQVDVVSLLRTKAMEARNDHPGITIRTDVGEDVPGTTCPDVGKAIDEVLANAVEHTDTDGGAVTVRARTTAGGVRIRISDEGPGIPDTEVDALARGRETELVHTSGLGLWVAQWIVEGAGGDFAVETDGDGTTVTIELPTGRDELDD
ncbi:MAG: PAS domain-containing sensor histidine kinase [Halanaeroarchaeum sp.]